MSPDRSAPGLVNLSLPVLLLGGAFVVSQVVTTVQGVRDQRILARATENQVRATQEGERVRAQLQSVLGGATALARDGDASAKAVLDALAEQGVKYTP